MEAWLVQYGMKPNYTLSRRFFKIAIQDIFKGSKDNKFSLTRKEWLIFEKFADPMRQKIYKLDFLLNYQPDQDQKTQSTTHIRNIL